ncbi:unnamed protein product [Boreogadus saida]
MALEATTAHAADYCVDRGGFQINPSVDHSYASQSAHSPVETAVYIPLLYLSVSLFISSVELALFLREQRSVYAMASKLEGK